MVLELRITIKLKLLVNQFVYIHGNAQVGRYSDALLFPPFNLLTQVCVCVCVCVLQTLYHFL
jgi:hypothetical protein